MKLNVISAAAAAMSGSTSPAAIAASTAAPTPAPAAQGGEGEADTQVVLASEVAAAVDTARAAGATAERDRTAKVFASTEGKANPQMAAFMLNSNPGATADAIVAHLATMPAAAAAAPAAPVAEAAPPAPPAPITTPLAQTPTIDLGVAPHQGGGGKSEKEVEASWDTAISNANAGVSRRELAPGIPATGN